MHIMDWSNFPPLPIAGSQRLIPLVSWREVVGEAQQTGIEFDDFWLDSIEEQVAGLFSWRGVPRATVLVVWEDWSESVTWIECRGVGDTLLDEAASFAIVAETEFLFRTVGFRCGTAH